MPFALPLPETPRLETERLVLRPLRIEDAPAIQQHFAHWEMVRHLVARVPWPYPADGAEINVRECLAKRERGEQFYWAMTLRDGDGELIGRIDLRPDAGVGAMRGFWLAQEYWGRGLMTEAADAVNAYAFEVLDWPFIDVSTNAANLASQRIKEKQGFTPVGKATDSYVEGIREKAYWRLTQADWRARRDLDP
jgi:ribosomal-protein-alanine N-acetyltransferase